MCVTTAGGVKCWGKNEFGQLGDGTYANKNTPVDVIGLSSGVIGLGAAEAHTCALTTAGGVKCWGKNDHGQLGDGTLADKNTPVDVSGLSSDVMAVSANGFHSCALTTAGGVKCWGYNEFGQLGNGTYEDKKTPFDVSSLASVIAELSAGWEYTCGRTTDGGVNMLGKESFRSIG